MKNRQFFLTIVVAISIFSFGTLAESAIHEYPYVYKSPRAMGMGGAYIAIGGKVDALFYNPAALSRMPEKNWEVNLIQTGFEVGKNVTDFASDIVDATDTTDINQNGREDDDQLKAVLDVIAKYRGKNLHLNISGEALSFGRNGGEKTAWGFGTYINTRLDAKTHQGFGTEGLIEVNADVTGGEAFGISYKIREDIIAGLGLKYFYRAGMEHNFSAREIVEKQDDLGNYIMDESVKQGGAYGVDLGGLYYFAQTSWFRPIVGLSIMNMGMNFGDAGDIPTTVNLGVSINPEEVLIFKGAKAGFDVIDVFRSIDEDKDIPKRIRLGAELPLFDKRLVAGTMRTGLYQGYPTFGADLRLLIVNLNYTTYAEEIGAYAGHDKDRRHLIAINVGW